MWRNLDRMSTASHTGAGALTRRGVLGAVLLGALGSDARAVAATLAPGGLVLPRLAAPHMPLTDVSGRAITLSAQLRGKVTAMQLMFAGCSSTCPIQGAVFAAVAQKVKAPDVQLLSLTVDPLGDSPQALRDWLGRFGPYRFWTAGLPRVQDVDALAEFLRGVPPNPGTHSSRVFLFDRQARLAFRTVELPSAHHVAELLAQLAAA
jgi:protein SCO1